MANALQKFKQSGAERLPKFQNSKMKKRNPPVGPQNRGGREYLGSKRQKPQSAVGNATEQVLKQRAKESNEDIQRTRTERIGKQQVKVVPGMRKGMRQAVGRKAMSKGGLMKAVKNIVGKKLSEKKYLSD